MKKGEHEVKAVSVRTRHDCCGDRFAGVKVFISGQYCGQFPKHTETATWYSVTCPKPLVGKEVKLVHTRNNYLSLSGIKIDGNPIGAKVFGPEECTGTKCAGYRGKVAVTKSGKKC
jgi:hypothetical protein